MRKESLKIARAFRDGVAARAARTTTNGQEVRLHGNLIAYRDGEGNIWASMAGWGTVTTRDRLNTLCRVLGSRAGFYQKNHAQYFSGPHGDIDIDPRDWVVIDGPDYIEGGA